MAARCAGVERDLAMVTDDSPRARTSSELARALSSPPPRTLPPAALRKTRTGPERSAWLLWSAPPGPLRTMRTVSACRWLLPRARDGRQIPRASASKTACFIGDPFSELWLTHRTPVRADRRTLSRPLSRERNSGVLAARRPRGCCGQRAQTWRGAHGTSGRYPSWRQSRS